LISSSWDISPDGVRTRMYHSWDYKELDFPSFEETKAPAVTEDDCLF
jgi:hypothetical protein